jgi:hypothetical protein
LSAPANPLLIYANRSSVARPLPSGDDEGIDPDHRFARFTVVGFVAFSAAIRRITSLYDSLGQSGRHPARAARPQGSFANRPIA